VPSSEYGKIESIASAKGLKVGTYLRKVTPFILAHTDILELDESILHEFGALVRNRKLLADMKGEQCSEKQLTEKGFDFSRYTGCSIKGYSRIIKVLDYQLSEIKPSIFTIKPLEYGSV